MKRGWRTHRVTRNACVAGADRAFQVCAFGVRQLAAALLWELTAGIFDVALQAIDRVREKAAPWRRTPKRFAH